MKVLRSITLQKPPAKRVQKLSHVFLLHATVVIEIIIKTSACCEPPQCNQHLVLQTMAEFISCISLHLEVLGEFL